MTTSVRGFRTRARLSLGGAVLLALLCGAGNVPAAPAPVASPLNEGVHGLDLGVVFPGAVLDPAVPTLREVTGIDPGARPLRPEEALVFF